MADVGPAVILSPFERRMILAFAEAAIPAVEGLSVPLSRLQEPWLEKFEDLLKHMPSEQRRGLRMMIRLIEFSPAIFSLRLTRFSALSLDEREGFLRQWEQSRWLGRRLYLLALKALVGMSYCSLDEVSRQLGYDKKCLTER